MIGTFDAERLEKLSALRGLISVDTGLVLAELAADVDPQDVIVEVGSFCGKSTAFLAEGARLGAGATVVAVDPWDLNGNVGGKHGFNRKNVRETFWRQLTSLDLHTRVVAMQGFSSSVAARFGVENDLEGVGLLFIDGDHRYESVRDDFEAWRPHLVPGAITAFDDYGTKRNPGVKAFVDETFGDAAEFPVPTLAVVEDSRIPRVTL